MLGEIVILWPAVPAANNASSVPSEAKVVVVEPPSVVQLAVALSHAPSIARFQVSDVPACENPVRNTPFAAMPIAKARDRIFDFVCWSLFCILIFLLGC